MHDRIRGVNTLPKNFSERAGLKRRLARAGFTMREAADG
jgi:hypothetical protein